MAATGPVWRRSVIHCRYPGGDEACHRLLSEVWSSVVHMLDTSPVAAVVEPRVLPEGLASLPPGPGLSAVLASVDRSRLAPADVFEVLAAQHRLVSHFQGRMLAGLWEAGRLT